MKKFFSNKENIIVIISYTLSFLLIAFLITRNSKIFASTTDFDSQHYLIPEYFRNLFYSNHDLLPDFALNLGGGVNIFYLSYYGLLNPIILLSYLMPNIPMLYYVIGSTSILTILSSILFYKYLRKTYDFKSSFLGGYLFLMATPLIFHTHRHIMFVDYFLFEILALYGLDRYLKEKKFLLLVFSLLMIILTSYYFSVGAFITIFIYALYKMKWRINFKKFWKLALPFILALMLGMVIILPTIYVILHSRASGSINLSLVKLFIPNLSFKYLLYSPYGPGLSLISLIASIYYFFKGDKNDKILCLIILLLSVFPIFNYILNGTLYIDSKSLIPFIPLIIIITTKFIDNIFKKEVDFHFVIKIMLNIALLALIELLIDYFFNNNNYGFISLIDTFGYSFVLVIEVAVFLCIWYFKYHKKGQKAIFKYLLITPFIICLIANFSDNLMPKNEYHEEIDKKEQIIINNIINSDHSFYRIGTLIPKMNNFNKIRNIKEYQSSIYSSTNSKSFSELYYETFANNIIHRNRAMIDTSVNPLFNTFMGEKYIITTYDLPYKKLTEKSQYKVYQNENAFPIGYASANILSQSDYDKLNYPSKEVNMLSNIITNQKTNNTPVIVDELNINDYQIIKQDNLNMARVNDKYYQISTTDGHLQIKLNNVKATDLLFLSFKNNNNPDCSNEDLSITINHQKNKLTCSNWKYHNQNYIFHYTITGTNVLNIHFSKGEYLLSDFKIYSLPYSDIAKFKENIDPFVPDKIKGDNINGHINVKQDGYFIIQIPYDSGFNIKVDNKIINYENVNNGVIGFKISKGYHKIQINYHAPYKTLGLIINAAALVIIIIILLLFILC